VTKRACVIGYPVAHSRSPLIHGYWLREHELDGDYVRHEVKPEEIDAFLKNFSKSGFVGCNVTLPHKEAAARNVTNAAPVVRALGVANTLWLEGETLRADNSDVRGFVAHLDDTIPGWDTKTKHAVILGAGGAARAVVYGLNDRGVKKITIVNRSRERAEQLVKEIKIESNIAGFDQVETLISSADMLINTTSLGMKGQPPLQIDLKNLKRGAAVCDVVYVPLETELLRKARERGHPTIDGLGMLLHQAVVGFERWFGVKPKVTPELRAHVVTDLMKDAAK
jgi:shikimate dehydrogenase